MRARLLFSCVSLLAVGALHCGDDSGGGPVASSDAGTDGAEVNGEGGPPAPPSDVPLVPASKVDILFVVDNSASMDQKQGILKASVGRILERLTTASSAHAAIKDIHVGVISTSLAGQGGDVCTPATDSQAHLVDDKVLSTTDGNITDLTKQVGDAITSLGAHGCGFEAQLESMYRFLVEPDPPAAIVTDAGPAAIYSGVDGKLLSQRKEFLRPDSAVAVVMLTDEDDSNINPRAIDGTAWAFTNKIFPGSQVTKPAGSGTTAARGTSICATDPASDQCKSCAICTDETCKNDTACKTAPEGGPTGPGFDGFYAPPDDDFNVRFYRMKERFGVDPQYAVERYITGLSERTVPNRDGSADCTNPLFADGLPGTDTEEVCKLTPGGRSRQLVFFTLIGGVPPDLVSASPDWTKIVGAAPELYDETGIDLHMIRSIEPRDGLTGADLPVGNNGTDPVHGREYRTGKADLQYACTFDLPAPVTCLPNDGYCECTSTSTANPPLCSGPGTQVKGKAYPTIRELRVVKGLGSRGVLGSICTPGGYASTFDALADRMSVALAK